LISSEVIVCVFIHFAESNHFSTGTHLVLALENTLFSFLISSSFSDLNHFHPSFVLGNKQSILYTSQHCTLSQNTLKAIPLQDKHLIQSTVHQLLH